MDNKITKDTKKKPVLNPKGGKTVTGKPADTIDISPQIEKQVNEQSRGGVVLAFGRMNPPTVGHEKLANKILAVAKQYGAKPMLFLSHSQDKKKNPLDYADKIRFAKKAFGAMVQSSPAKTLIDVAKLVQVHYKDLYVIAGADRVTEFETLLNKYNGKEFNFDSIKVVSAGERDPDSDSVEGMSASKMREAVKTNNFAAFKGGLPARLRSGAKEVFDLTKLGMQLAEELEAAGLELIESLTVDQRRKRGLIMRRNETKIQRAKELAKKRLASSDQLKKRAINKARDLIRRRLAGGKDYHSLTTAEKITIDKRMEKRKSAVNKLAKRIMNKVKTAEYERLKSYVAGQKELPTPKNEAFNQAFSAHVASSIPAVDTDGIIAEMIQLVLDKSITEKETQSLHNKASKSGIAYDLIEQVFIRGLLDSMGDHAAAFNRVNAFIAGGKTAMNEDHDLYQKANPTDVNAIFEAKMNEDLRTWFNQKWVRMDTTGKIKGDCAREEGEGKPKCLPLAKAQSMDKTDRAKAARRKRREDPVADREGKGGKPVNVATEAYITEKNSPTNPALWSRAKSLARSKFDVYPSAYANGWAAKWYKSKGGGWKSVSEAAEAQQAGDDHETTTNYKLAGQKIFNNSGLSDIEKTIVTRVVIHGHTANNVAKDMNISRARVDQIRNKALRRMKDYSSKNKIQKQDIFAEDINAEFLASLAAALNDTPGQVAPSTGTKDRKGIENVSRGDDVERDEIVNVQRKKSKTNSIAKQANIRHGLDEAFKLVLDDDQV